MILSVSARNIWRSKTRSIVILVAIMLGVWVGIFNVAFYNGMAIQRIQSAIAIESSHIQIHAKEYLNDPSDKNFMPNADELMAKLNQSDSSLRSSSRLIVQGMIQSSITNRGVKVIGINKETESKVSDLKHKVIDGYYLEKVKRNPIVIGAKLAEKLKVKVRSKVVLQFADKDGNLTGASFRVAGIYETSNSMYDGINVFVRKTDLAKLFNVNANAAHEIAILLKNHESVDEATQRYAESMSQVDVQSWRQLKPDVSLLETSLDLYMFIFMFIILLALLFGIINTMLMAVLERTKELGMLMAVGMNNKRVFLMIMLETVILTTLGGVVGIVLGAITTFITQNSGIDISVFAEGANAMGYDSIIYPDLSVKNVIEVTSMVFVTGVLAAVYPALKAIKLKPAEAIRIDM